jgi:uncharacterized protein YodC (DUF2158 family)
MSNFKIGDVVTLKNNQSIKMTVNKFYKENYNYECVWFNDSHLNRENFDSDTLVLFPKIEIPEEISKALKYTHDQINTLSRMQSSYLITTVRGITEQIESLEETGPVFFIKFIEDNDMRIDRVFVSKQRVGK